MEEKAVTQNDLYAGDVSPGEAWEALEENDKAVLVDVRTQAEWVFVGGPDLASLGKKPLQLSWKIYPSMELNTDFTTHLLNEIPDNETALYFLCRSGGRSLDAAIAMAEKGYSHCYNIAGGFEGEPNSDGHRSASNCWKSENLPWRQN